MRFSRTFLMSEMKQNGSITTVRTKMVVNV
jgi:hypothetical protein